MLGFDCLWFASTVITAGKSWLLSTALYRLLINHAGCKESIPVRSVSFSRGLKLSSIIFILTLAQLGYQVPKSTICPEPRQNFGPARQHWDGLSWRKSMAKLSRCLARQMVSRILQQRRKNRSVTLRPTQ